MIIQQPRWRLGFSANQLHSMANIQRPYAVTGRPTLPTQRKNVPFRPGLLGEMSLAARRRKFAV